MKQIFKTIFKTCVLSGLFLLSGCSAHRTIENTTESEKTVKYERVVEYKDSLIYIEIPKESEKAFTFNTDTLFLNTSMATAKAWLDTTTLLLNGEIKNKPVTLPKTVQIPKIIEKTDTIEKDAQVKTEYIEKPYIPNFYRWFVVISLCFCTGTAGYLGYWIGSKGK